MRYSFQEIKTTIKIHGLLLFSIATSFCNYAQEKNEDEVDDLLEELFFSDQQNPKKCKRNITYFRNGSRGRQSSRNPQEGC